MDRNDNNRTNGQYVVDYRLYQYPRGVNRVGGGGIAKQDMSNNKLFFLAT